MPDFSALPLPLNLVLFTAGAVVVWFAGSRLTYYADAISNATDIGQAAIGIMLLAGVTSLPEIGVTATAAIAGNADLAVNNLFGSIALQVAVLAVVDFLIGRKALTAAVADPTVILQGSLNIIMISAAAAAMVIGDVSVFGVGLWAWGAIAAYVSCIHILSRGRGRRPWLAAGNERVEREPVGENQDHGSSASDRESKTLRSLVVKTAGVAAIILVAGYVVAKSGEAIAEQTGLGSSFVGFVLVAIATSLPELSTALSAARRGLFTMAISDILGTNLINIAMIFLVDLLDTGEPVIGRMGPFAIFGALLAVVLTALFQAGVAERRDKAILRMGYDSLLVLIVYVGGVVLLYTLRSTGT
ncbi:sodium:calcium antiporter [Nitratireductor luteus]|uniref:sodium:calcium antiporter n=1 Tax=Nitratireductor luteus TaxID=2976980 RepID=UPI00224094FB|nr:sodium:calcium antiporter [Nitratireductor luteus]